MTVMIARDPNQTICVPQLIEELRAAGLTVTNVIVTTDRLDVEGESLTEASVSPVVASHVPAPGLDTDTPMQNLRARALEVFRDPINNQFTTVQINRIVAALVLKATR